MPAVNRDRESIYAPGRLSLWFAVSSVLLLLSFLWMFWADYDRPWKGYQSEFNDKFLDVAKAKRERAKDGLERKKEDLEKAKAHAEFARSVLAGNEATIQALEELAEAAKPYLQAEAAHLALVERQKKGQAKPEEVAAAKAAADAARPALDAKAREVLPASLSPEDRLEAARGAGGHAAAAKQLKKIRAELPEALAVAKEKDDEVKFVKGLHSPAKYKFEVAEEHYKKAQEEGEGAPDPSELEAAREVLNRYASWRNQAEIAFTNAQSTVDAKRREIEELEKPYRALLKAHDGLREDYAKAETTYRGLIALYKDNPWRNAPVIDFISPSIKIRQVVVKEVHDNWNFATSVKVDRCQTCHVGVDIPDMGDESLWKLFFAPRAEAGGKIDHEALAAWKKEHGFEGWMQPHTAQKLIAGAGKHPVERFGCTVCHHGVGWSTDFRRSAHSPRDRAQRKDWEERRDFDDPEFVDFPMLPPQFVEGQCIKCHKAGMYYEPTYLETLDHGLTEQRRFPPTDPRSKTPENRVLGAHEVYGAHKLPPAPDPVDGTEEEVAQATRAWLRDRLKPIATDENDRVNDVALDAAVDHYVKSFGWRAEKFGRGYDRIVEYGCQGCHKIAGFGLAPGWGDAAPPKVAPDLTYVKDKVRDEWLLKWILHPDAFRADTRMPSFFRYMVKDRDWKPVLKDGKPQYPLVMDAHVFEGPDDLRAIGPISTSVDVDRANLEVLAIKMYLFSLGRSRADAKDPSFDRLYTVDPPAGDVEEGRKTVASMGCMACHVVPEVEGEGGRWVPDDGARFKGEPAQGPRLDGLGSKFKDRRWLNAWLARPRHYTAHTKMPFMRWRDVKDAEGSIARTAEQVRADVVDYLLAHKNPMFDSIEVPAYSTSYDPLLKDMYEEFFGKTSTGDVRARAVVEGEREGLALENVLARVGERLMARRGCFGCHNVVNHEDETPVGTELTKEGIKDLHQLDFGYVHEVPHSRANFIRTKIAYPRIWDARRVVRWTDKLRMPRFNFRMDDHTEGVGSTRDAVAGIVLGLVEEPIQPTIVYRPDDFAKDVIRGRAVVQRYGCNNCHTIEGKRGLFWGYLADKDPQSFDPGTAPPNLFSIGNRIQDGFLMKFLMDPIDLRPIVVPRMPKFELNDEEAEALVRYFARLGGNRLTVRPQPDSRLAGRLYERPVDIAVKDASHAVPGAVEEAELLFETINCNACHIPKGTPGADPEQGGVAPPFALSSQRLRRDWVRRLLDNPQHLITGTKMPQIWPTIRGYGRGVEAKYHPFQFDLRNDEEWKRLWASSDPEEKAEAEKRLAEAQIEAITDYVLHHFRLKTPAEPK
jgi:cytochrome c2